jgi:hypothetical protein
MITQSSLQWPHLPGLMGVMYAIGPLALIRPEPFLDDRSTWNRWTDGGTQMNILQKWMKIATRTWECGNRCCS